MPVNPLTRHVPIAICLDAEDAINKGFNWKAQDVKPIEVKQCVVVRNGTEQGNATVDFLLEDDSGQLFVFMITGNLLRAIPC